MRLYTAKHIPLLKVLIVFVWGICLGFSIESYPFVIVYLELLQIAAFLFMVVGGILARRRFWRKLYTWTLYLSILLFGVWKTVNQHPLHQLDHFSHFEDDLLIGVVDEDPVYKGEYVRCPIRVTGTVDPHGRNLRSGRLMLTISEIDSAQRLSYGDEIIFRNTIKKLVPPLNPAEFDYRRHLSNTNIWHQGFIARDQLQIWRHRQGSSLSSFALQVRNQLTGKFQKQMKDTNAFHVASAVILGYRAPMDQEVIQAFNDTGTIHLLSVSGLHVGLVFGILIWLLSWMNRIPGGVLIRTLVILIGVWAYTVMCGMSPPVVRAAIMISFYILANLIKGNSNVYNTIAASAFVMLVYNTKQLADIGFQLSYLAVLGIVLVVPMLNGVYSASNRYMRGVFTYCYVSLGAQLLTLPLILYYFGQFPNYFLLANLLIAIPSSLIMYLGLGLAIIPFDSIQVVLGYLLNELIVFTLSGLKFLAGMPGSITSGISFNGLQVTILFTVISFLLLSFYTKDKRSIWAVLCSMLLLSITVVYHDVKRRNYQGVKFYSVKNNFAVAYISKGKVSVFSNLDSLSHPTLVYSVLPDLLKYSHEESIIFNNILAGPDRSNGMISNALLSILVVERRYLSDVAKTADILLLRKNSAVELDQIIPQVRPKLVLLDGSSSDKKIVKYMSELDSLAVPYYCMKNNFAYVWNKDLP